MATPRKWTYAFWRHILLPNTGLTVTPFSATRLDLAWVSANDGISSTNVQVERSVNGSTGWAVIAVLPRGTMAYSDASLAHAQTRSYRVRRYKYNTGFGPYSSVVAGTTS